MITVITYKNTAVLLKVPSN